MLKFKTCWATSWSAWYATGPDCRRCEPSSCSHLTSFQRFFSAAAKMLNTDARVKIPPPPKKKLRRRGKKLHWLAPDLKGKRADKKDINQWGAAKQRAEQKDGALTDQDKGQETPGRTVFGAHCVWETVTRCAASWPLSTARKSKRRKWIPKKLRLEISEGGRRRRTIHLIHCLARQFMTRRDAPEPPQRRQSYI